MNELFEDAVSAGIALRTELLEDLLGGVGISSLPTKAGFRKLANRVRGVDCETLVSMVSLGLRRPDGGI